MPELNSLYIKGQKFSVSGCVTIKEAKKTLGFSMPKGFYRRAIVKAEYVEKNFKSYNRTYRGIFKSYAELKAFFSRTSKTPQLRNS